MMTTGYMLIAAILILGGVIATVGDRIGTRVGKARLSLFNLRPRNTAVVVTILTGGIISGSTLAILFAASDQLRIGVFKLGEIQGDLRDKRQELKTTREQLGTTTTEKNKVEAELAKARAEQKAEQIEAQKQQAAAAQRLAEINQSLQAAIAKQSQTEAQLNRTQTQQAQTEAQLDSTQVQLGQVFSQFQQAQNRLGTVTQQAKALREEIQQLQAERQQLLAQRNQVKAQIAKRDRAIAKLDQSIEQRDRDIAQRDQVIAKRETRLKELEQQQEYLEREVTTLEQDYQQFKQQYQTLRRGNLVLFRGQVLASGVVRIVQPTATRQAVDELLRQANRTAIELTQPGTTAVNERAVQITEAQVDQLTDQIKDGRDYVVRIISAGNYVRGEKSVQVFADAAPNQVVFRKDDVVAATSADPTSMSSEELQQRVNLLLVAAKFRARNAGILEDRIQIGDNRFETLIRFVEQLRQYNRPVDIKAVAAEDNYTTGPLKLQLVAIRNGEVVFRTNTANEEVRGAFGSPPPDDNSSQQESLSP